MLHVNVTFQVANDIDIMPTFGAGSEFGREQKEEARRKKYGINRKLYNPEDQPWQLKIGKGQSARKFKVKLAHPALSLYGRYVQGNSEVSFLSIILWSKLF